MLVSGPIQLFVTWSLGSSPCRWPGAAFLCVLGEPGIALSRSGFCIPDAVLCEDALHLGPKVQKYPEAFASPVLCFLESKTESHKRHNLRREILRCQAGQKHLQGAVGGLGSGEERSRRLSHPERSADIREQWGGGGSLLPCRAMASADLNQDGYGDLVVGAPGYSRPGHVQVGRIYLLYGNDLGLPPIDLDLDKEAHVILEGFQVRHLSLIFPFRVCKLLRIVRGGFSK